MIIMVLLKIKKNVFMRERERASWGRGWERDKPTQQWAWTPTEGSIPQPWDHAPLLKLRVGPPTDWATQMPQEIIF